MEEKTLLYQGLPVYYRLTGKGKTVMLLHGFGEDGNVWQQQIHFLQNNYRLIIPDIPGSGRSPLLKKGSMEIYAEVMKFIFDAETQQLPAAPLQEIILIGHSMGGYVALAFVEKYPAYLASFGLFHSSAFADNAEKKQARLTAISAIKKNGAHAFLKTSTPALFTKEFAEKYPEKIEGLIDTGENFTAAALVQYYEAMIERPDRTAILANFPNPILFIIGEHDTAIPLQISLQQCYLPARSDVNILNQSAHMGMWEEPDKANDILLRFLSED